MSSKHLLRCEVNTYLHKHTFKVFSPVAVSACLCARAHVYVHVCVCSSGESSASALRQVCPLRKGPLTAQSALDWEPINQGSHWDEHTHMHTHLCSQTYIRCLKWLMKGEGKDCGERDWSVKGFDYSPSRGPRRGRRMTSLRFNKLALFQVDQWRITKDWLQILPLHLR